MPIVEETDVIVCGGGPAGTAAAIAAARAGARVRLLEGHGCLGGIWTAGLLSWIIDVEHKTGLMEELLAEIERRRAWALATPETRGTRRDRIADPELLKLLLEDLCRGAGVKVRLHTHVVGAVVEEGQMRLAITESKSGREAWAGKVFVDATGDGDLAAYAGCGYDLGHPQTGQMQPMSLIMLLTGLDPLAVQDCINKGPAGHAASKKAMLAELEAAGFTPSYAAPTLFDLGGGLMMMMANHEYGVSGLSADDLTVATLRARAELHRLVAALRGLGGRWANVRLVATGEQIGVREGRRIHGRYTVTAEDMLRGACHVDAICRVNFPVDVHSLDPTKGKAYGTDGVGPTKSYDIPLRALIAKDVEGLLLAGRCISGDFWAHASYRVSGNAVAMGQAAGVLAALAVATGRPPSQVTWAEMRGVLGRLNTLCEERRRAAGLEP